MRALAGYILRGPLQAILVTAGLALLSVMLLPVANLVGAFSAAALALVALQLGGRQAAVTLVGSLVILGAASLLMPIPTSASMGMLGGLTFALWLPVLIPALVLRRTRSLPMALEVTALLGVAAVVGAYMALGDPAAVWLKLLAGLKQELAQAGAPPMLQESYAQLGRFAPYLTGAAMAALMVNVMFSLLLARGLQAALNKPGGLREEFNRLRYDRVTFAVTVVALATAFLTRAPLAVNVAIVLVTAYAFHGLAVIHGSAARARLGFGWLVAFYVVMFLKMDYVAVVLVVLGLIDTWVDFRARVRPRKAG